VKLLPKDAEIFAEYPRAIAHMHRQLRSRRFGLILGSGVSKPLGFPNWKDLIKRIAEDPSVCGVDLIATLQDKPLPLQAQILFKRFCERTGKEVAGNWPESDAQRIVRARWRNLVHDCLYRDVQTDPTALRNSVYGHFARVVKDSPMTVTYNFDDSLERLILDDRSQQEEETTRGYETVVDARLQFQRDSAIIYHPNGFLPYNLLDNPSEHVVLTEDSFGDQLIETMSGHFASLVNHLSKNTCLFLGLSLEDQTLRHILRQHARMNPGHVHYYVQFVNEPPSEETRKAERDANFGVFNLVTLFLDRDGLASLGRLIVAAQEDILEVGRQAGQRTGYIFYVTGVPGSGKTTTTSYLRNLITYDEWLEQRPANLAKPHAQLTDEQRKEVDEWIMEQIHVKNNRLDSDSTSSPIGIRFVDRCLIDPVVFSKDDQWPDKARAIKRKIAPGLSEQTVRSGHVILLIGDEKEMAVRVESQNKESDPDYTGRLQRAMERLYAKEPGVTHLDVRGMSVGEVVKRVSEIVHLNDYAECNLQNLLDQVDSGKIVPPAD
jgi:hypothetical protein